MKKWTVSLFVLMGIFIMPLISSANENISLVYPASVISGETFQVNVTLINFSEGMYDIKIDITNSTNSSDRLSEMYNGSTWRSTNYYFYNATNTSASNTTTLSLNITQNYNGTGNITVTARKSSTTYPFAGYSINITPAIVTSCTQSWSCTSWSTCSSSSQTRTCTDSNNCGNNTGKPAVTQSCTSIVEPSIEIEWDDEDIVNGEEFWITVNVENLEDLDYDVKLWFEFEENTTIISERYGEYDDEDVWKSGQFYIEKLFSGPGNKTDEVKIRIDENYIDFSGDAAIKAKLRETTSGDVVDDSSESIEVLEANEETTTTTASSPSTATTTSTTSTSTSNQNTGAIALTGNAISTKTTENSMIYKSKNEYIKEYAPYAFSLLCIFLIALLLIDKRR